MYLFIGVLLVNYFTNNFVEYAGHAKEKAKTLDMQKYDTIVICSGDGLGNEVSPPFDENQYMVNRTIDFFT